MGSRIAALLRRLSNFLVVMAIERGLQVQQQLLSTGAGAEPRALELLSPGSWADRGGPPQSGFWAPADTSRRLPGSALTRLGWRGG